MTHETEDTLFFIKNNVSLHEYKMQQYIYNLDIVYVPNIVKYDETTQIMIMQKICNINISDTYGDKNKDTSPELYEKIRKIINTLYINNISYPDITGYNFIEEGEKIWIIDFEHAQYNPKKYEPFIKKFINGYNGWNKIFK